jgi:flagellar biosynthesis protein FliR
MTFIVDPAWAVCVFLLSLRLGALFVLSPIWGVTGAPPSFRVLFLLALSAVLVSALPAAAFAAPQSLGALAFAAASELAIGALLAFGVFAAFAAFMLAGKVLDVQIGFGSATCSIPSRAASRRCSAPCSTCSRWRSSSRSTATTRCCAGSPSRWRPCRSARCPRHFPSARW